MLKADIYRLTGIPPEHQRIKFEVKSLTRPLSSSVTQQKCHPWLHILPGRGLCCTRTRTGSSSPRWGSRTAAPSTSRRKVTSRRLQSPSSGKRRRRISLIGNHMLSPILMSKLEELQQCSISLQIVNDCCCIWQINCSTSTAVSHCPFFSLGEVTWHDWFCPFMKFGRRGWVTNELAGHWATLNSWVTALEESNFILARNHQRWEFKMGQRWDFMERHDWGLDANLN